MGICGVKIHCKYDELLERKSLKPHPKNRNKHPEEQIARLAQILKYQGIRAPIVISKLSNYVVKGHGTLEACWLNGWDKAPVVYQEFENEEQEYAYIQSDNAIALWAELDLTGINTDLGDLGPDFDIDLLGIKDFVLEPAGKFTGDEDAVPDVPKSSNIKPGELFLLGQHRLLCGDATNPNDVALVMNGEKADMVFTDPPYGVNAVHNRRVGFDAPIGWGKTRGENYPRLVKAKLYAPVHGDDKPFDPKPYLELSSLCILWGANYFHDKLPLGWRWIVWDKKAEIGTDEGPFSDCELAWTNAKGRAVKIYRHLWAGLLRAGERKEELTARVHPTQKPVGLCGEVIKDFSEEQQLIIDPFLGSGSTLIACEKTNRKCYGMEIDPLYCDVIIKRWEDYTGKKAEKIG